MKTRRVTRTKRVTISLLLLLFVVGISSACDDDQVLGAPCDRDGDCEDICATGPDFPGGMCTYLCDEHSHCPDYWVCADLEGGVCMETCSTSGMCERLYGERWRCKDVDLVTKGKDRVCVGD